MNRAHFGGIFHAVPGEMLFKWVREADREPGIEFSIWNRELMIMSKDGDQVNEYVMLDDWSVASGKLCPPKHAMRMTLK